MLLLWLSCLQSEPFHDHSRPGCQATAGRISCTTGLRGHHPSSEEAAACAVLGCKEQSFARLHWTLTSVIPQHSLCSIAASQDRNGIERPSAKHTDVPQKSRGSIFHSKRDLQQLPPSSLDTGISLLKGLSRINYRYFTTESNSHNVTDLPKILNIIHLFLKKKRGRRKG